MPVFPFLILRATRYSGLHLLFRHSDQGGKTSSDEARLGALSTELRCIGLQRQDLHLRPPGPKPKYLRLSVLPNQGAGKTRRW